MGGRAGRQGRGIEYKGSEKNDHQSDAESGVWFAIKVSDSGTTSTQTKWRKHLISPPGYYAHGRSPSLLKTEEDEIPFTKVKYKEYFSYKLLARNLNR